MQKFYNRTRKTKSIPIKLLKEGKFFLIPFYYLLMTSDLAKEGITNSGSYRFADHVYDNQPKGRYLIGKFMDSIILKLKATRSLRARYIYALEEIKKFAESSPNSEQTKILAVPSGLARELFESADCMKIDGNSSYQKIVWHGIDLDQELVKRLQQQATKSGHEMFFRQGDALVSTDYSEHANYDMILSMGFVDFLDDPEAQKFYKIIYGKLNPGGIFYTSGMQPHKFSEFLMSNFAELKTRYRSDSQLRALAEQAGFTDIRTYQDELQTIIISKK